MAAIVAFYVMAMLLPRRSGPASPLTMWLRVGGTLLITGLILLATVYTQSRGPLLGLAAGLFTFFFLLLWQAMRRAREMGATSTARWMGVALWAWGGVTVLALAFLIVFNLSDTPFFNRLREQPYIGRFGTLLETRYGTGRVRFLIWNGDEHAGGARELITTDPVRTFVGWGPESMFVAFNPFYPPSLAEVESRGASPDRSHQAILDEMVTKGLLGLISYFFLIISFFALGWRMMRQSSEWRWQVFFIACMSMVISHLVEGLTGIPIVSTLTMVWVAMALTVSGGMLAGHYTLGRPTSAATKLPEEAATETSDQADAESTPDTTTAEDAKAAPSPGSKRGKKKNKQRGTSQATAASTAAARPGGSGGRSVARGGTSATRTGASRVTSRGSSRRQTSPAALALYAVLMVLTLGAAWQLNLRTVYADMLFHMGQSYSGQASGNLNAQVRAMDYFLKTIRNDRTEDFYYLNLGRSLMQIAAVQRQNNIPMGEAEPEIEDSEEERSEQINRLVNELLTLPDDQAVISFIQSHTPSELMMYAEAVLERAYELNPLNKDHYANLGRLNNFWYSWTQDITHLQDAATWYRRANEVAPQDVVLLNESARVALSLGRLLERSNDQENAEAYYNHAEYLLERAQTLDPGYPEYLAPLADLRKMQGDKAAAAELYARQIEVNPTALDETLDETIAWLSDSPDLLSKLSSAYMEQAQAAEEAPASKNPDVVEKYQDIDPSTLYARAGRLAVRAENWDMASQAYAQAVALKPENLEYRLNYTISLSDTSSYNEALQQAQEGLSLAETQADNDKVVQFDRLISLFEDKAAGGQ
jgi:tetratricopeptide (TPR) repeat protein